MMTRMRIAPRSIGGTADPFTTMMRPRMWSMTQSLQTTPAVAPGGIATLFSLLENRGPKLPTGGMAGPSLKKMRFLKEMMSSSPVIQREPG